MKRGLFICVLAGFIALSSSFNGGDSKVTKEELGKMLFFDPILSEDRTISCASCHRPEFAFADTSIFSRGVHGRLGKRNTPSVMNMSARSTFFWDGRAATLAEQALFPIADVNEMNLPIAEAVHRLNDHERYRYLFLRVFKQYPNSKNLGEALAAFQETLETSNTRNDRWLKDEPDGMTALELRGRGVFRTKAKCFDCHFSPDFTGDEFRSIGLFNGKDFNDSGRFSITHNPDDLGKFKTPGLRNVALTAPYMHDGSFKTLREVIDYYDQPHTLVPDAINRDSLLASPLNLTEDEKVALEAFLNALTDDRFLKK